MFQEAYLNIYLSSTKQILDGVAEACQSVEACQMKYCMFASVNQTPSTL